MYKTVVDYLKENNKFKDCFNGYEITLQLDKTKIIMEVGGYRDDKCDDRYVIEIENNTPMYEIQDIMYDEYNTEIRFCSECGKPYDAGYMAGDGEWYCCENCFEPVMDRDYGKGKWRATEEEGYHGGFYEYLDGDEWEDTGIFWTQWN